VPTRFDIHADADRKAANTHQMSGSWRENMNRILTAAAVLLVLGAPLALAMPNPTDMTTSELTTEHCANLAQDFSSLKFPNLSARQVAEQKAYAVCRQDRHKNGGTEWSSRTRPSSLVLMHR
jgi:hypothetical protein